MVQQVNKTWDEVFKEEILDRRYEDHQEEEIELPPCPACSKKLQDCRCQ